MDEPTHHIKPVAERTADSATFWGEHRFALLLVFTVIIAIVLTVISMTLYNISGAAQLDLSRPGYQSVSDQVDTTTKIDSYSASGPVNTETIREFMKLYDEQAKKAKAIDAFNGDPLNPEIIMPSTTPAE
jgi:hypothetical protein